MSTYTAYTGLSIISSTLEEIYNGALGLAWRILANHAESLVHVLSCGAHLSEGRHTNSPKPRLATPQIQHLQLGAQLRQPYKIRGFYSTSLPSVIRTAKME